MTELSVGDSMPDSPLVGESGPINLRDKIGKPLVVYFYPADETIGCTREACSFRDSYEDFTSLGADVIGISGDDAGSHASFKANHRLPFTLLSDPGHVVAKAWGLKKTLGLPPRVTFVFDQAGIVRHRFDSKVRMGAHVDTALEIVKSLR